MTTFVPAVNYIVYIGTTLTSVKKLWRHENFKRSWLRRCQFIGFFNCFIRELQSLLYVFNLSLDVEAVLGRIFFDYTCIDDTLPHPKPRERASPFSHLAFP